MQTSNAGKGVLARLRYGHARFCAETVAAGARIVQHLSLRQDVMLKNAKSSAGILNDQGRGVTRFQVAAIAHQFQRVETGRMPKISALKIVVIAAAHGTCF